MSDTMLVRLRPYAPRQGQKIRRYMVYGMRFDEGRGWYEVPKAVAEYLRTVRGDSAENAPFAFDVQTQEGAMDLEERERRAKAEEVAKAEAPRVVPLAETSAALRSADLPSAAQPVVEAASAAPAATRRRARRFGE